MNSGTTRWEILGTAEAIGGYLENAGFELAQIASAHFCFIGEILLRHSSRVPQAAQIGGKHVSQVHARLKTGCLVYGTSIY